MADEAEAAPPVVSAFGDSALLVRIGNGADPASTERAWGIAEAIQAIRVTHPGIGRPVVGHASVLVPIDPLVVARAEAVSLLTDAMRVTATPVDSDDAEGEAVEIAVRYGGADGPDLDAVAAASGLTAADVVALHSAATYRVLFLGFAPGFAYLRGLPTELATPRRASPRERVPAGSVGIAGEQTGIYPRDLPGGWNLIGRTDAVLFDVARAEPALLRPGSAVRFLPAR